MKRYYFITAETQYDGLESIQRGIIEREIPLGKQLSQKEIEDYAEGMFLHQGTCEELNWSGFKEMSKKDYEIVKKYI